MAASVSRSPSGVAAFLFPISSLDESRFFARAQAEAKPLAAAVSRSLSGVASWPRLVLDPEGSIVVESRGANGEHQKSHWQTVLPLMAARPLTVGAGDRLRVRASVAIGARVDVPVQYSLKGELEKAPRAEPEA